MAVLEGSVRTLKHLPKHFKILNDVDFSHLDVGAEFNDAELALIDLDDFVNEFVDAFVEALKGLMRRVLPGAKVLIMGGLARFEQLVDQVNKRLVHNFDPFLLV